ncbi:MAG: helix-turn-helix transcriptional regulator [Planctomycetota bacterium]
MARRRERTEARGSIRYFFAHPPVDGPAFSIHGLGIREAMPPGLVDRPAGTGDCLFMLFHDAVEVGLEAGPTRLPPGRLVRWAAEDGHLYGNPVAPYTHTWIHCDGTRVHRLLDELALPLRTALPLSESGLMERPLLDLHEELSLQPAPDAAMAWNLFENLLRGIARDLRGQERPAPAGPPQRLLELRHYLDTHYAERLALDALAEQVHLSTPHLCAEFKKHFGMPVLEYVTHQRLRRALHELRDCNVTVTEAARRAGYDSLHYFSRLCRRRTGRTPTELRQGATQTD